MIKYYRTTLSNKMSSNHSTNSPVNPLLIPKYKDRTFNTHAQHLIDYTSSEYDNIFIGDSMMQRWLSTGTTFWNDNFKKCSANFGVGGDGVEHLIYRLVGDESKNIKGFPECIKKCKNIYLMIGTNNIDKRKPIQISEAIDKIIKLLKARIQFENFIIFAVTPRKDVNTLKINDLNKCIMSVCELNKVQFHNFNDLLDLNTDYDDNVHLNINGYKKWLTVLHSLTVTPAPTPMPTQSQSPTLKDR